MDKKTYYFSSFPTSYLIVLLEQKTNELTLLRAKYLEHYDNELLYKRICYLKVLTRLVKECVTERLLEEDMNLNKCGNLLVSSKGVKKEIMKDVFTEKIITEEGLISLELLKKVIGELDIDHLHKIKTNKENTIYSEYADKRFDEMLFEVDEEVKKELSLKMKNDIDMWG